MYLKRLDMAGFKSFPNKSTFEFPKGVTAVVGPNGSGKSNIADALRWVLGEQSMLRLRSKKGEDLIFNGSGLKGRMSKANVMITFDNADHRLPYEFSEVSISRKIYRDGQNQYYVNGSEVRLKDVVELIAKAKLGLKGYTIINQGMADVILHASALERKEIFEEALGLKEYQLKKKEALDKLSQTNANLKQAYTLANEIEPHLKFLKKQVAKIEKREEFLASAKALEEKYFAAQYGALEAQKKNISGVLNELDQGIKKSQSEFDGISTSIKEHEARWSSESKEHTTHDAKILELEAQQIEASKELGKIEGLLEAGIMHMKAKPINREKFAIFIKELRILIQGYESKSESALKEILGLVGQKLDVMSAEITVEHPIKEHSDLNDTQTALKNKLDEIKIHINKAKEQYRKDTVADGTQRSEFAKLHSVLREKEHEIAQLETRRHRLTLEHEQLLAREGELKQFFADRFDELAAKLKSGDLAAHPASDTGDMKKEIERLRVRLEMTMEIDPETQKEYSKLHERHEFLTKQSADLEASISDLQGIIKELEGKIEALFSEAFGKISDSFHHYFTILFNGGRASLAILKEQKQNIDELDEEEEKNTQAGGIEVKVELPGKKIKGLQMLSGGERALTSVALLLALVSTSPPPFMVLDEVDASLDETNSQRFARILQELKKNTQFVIVTHNREIMKESDVLYGVTMEEEGVSKLLSIELTKAEQYAQ